MSLQIAGRALDTMQVIEAKCIEAKVRPNRSAIVRSALRYFAGLAPDAIAAALGDDAADRTREP